VHEIERAAVAETKRQCESTCIPAAKIPPAGPRPRQVANLAVIGLPVRRWVDGVKACGPKPDGSDTPSPEAHSWKARRSS